MHLYWQHFNRVASSDILFLLHSRISHFFFFAFRFEASFGIQRFFFPREMKIASNTINRFIFFSAYCFAQVNARNSNLSQYFCFYILITPQRCLTESPRHFFIYSIWRISTLLQLVRSSLSQQRVEIISNFTRWSYIYIYMKWRPCLLHSKEMLFIHLYR